MYGGCLACSGNSGNILKGRVRWCFWISMNDVQMHPPLPSSKRSATFPRIPSYSPSLHGKAPPDVPLSSRGSLPTCSACIARTQGSCGRCDRSTGSPFGLRREEAVRSLVGDLPFDGEELDFRWRRLRAALECGVGTARLRGLDEDEAPRLRFLRGVLGESESSSSSTSMASSSSSEEGNPGCSSSSSCSSRPLYSSPSDSESEASESSSVRLPTTLRFWSLRRTAFSGVMVHTLGLSMSRKARSRC